MSGVRTVTMSPELSIHKEDLRLTYDLIKNATGKRSADQMDQIRQIGSIIGYPRDQVIGDQIPDIFLNKDTGLYQYLNGQNVLGRRYEGNGSWRPVPADDCTLRQAEQESYIHNVVIPAIAGMIIEQLGSPEPLPLVIMKPGAVHALMDICSQALTIAPDNLKEREARVNSYLHTLLDEARLNA